ncbi:MAG: hypothetical protein JRN20_22530 [Nitrososphaerota archaeon]|nr:hypothetical protein [Nitrososphaerota archaeon]
MVEGNERFDRSSAKKTGLLRDFFHFTLELRGWRSAGILLPWATLLFFIFPYVFSHTLFWLAVSVAIFLAGVLATVVIIYGYSREKLKNASKSEGEERKQTAIELLWLNVMNERRWRMRE